MPKAPIDWVPLFRAQLKEALVSAEGQQRSGWSVSEGRTGDMRLMYRRPGKADNGSRHKAQTVALPYQWEARSTGEALRRIREIFLCVEKGCSLQEAADLVDGRSSNTEGPDWRAVIEEFRVFKVEKQGVDPISTWKSRYEPAMKAVIAVMGSVDAPFNGTRLVEAVAEQKEFGSRTREQWVNYVNALLKFGQKRGLASAWAPHPEPSEATGPVKEAAHGVPITDTELLELLADIPNSPKGRRYRFAMQIMAVTGVRGSEVNEVQVIDGKLFCLTKKRTAKTAGTLRPLTILPVMLPMGGTTDFDIVARLEEGEPRPEITYGLFGTRLNEFLRDQSLVWHQLRRKYTAAGKRLVGCYCCRYRWVATAHRYGLPVSYMAEAAGHQPETAIRVYSRFDKEASREGVVNEVLDRIKQAAAG